MSLTFSQAKATVAELSAELDRTSAALDRFPKGPMGLTPDAVKFSPEYRSAKQAFDTAFAKTRAFNAVFTKTFAKELRAERLVRRSR